MGARINLQHPRYPHEYAILVIRFVQDFGQSRPPSNMNATFVTVWNIVGLSGNSTTADMVSVMLVWMRNQADLAALHTGVRVVIRMETAGVDQSPWPDAIRAAHMHVQPSTCQDFSDIVPSENPSFWALLRLMTSGS